MKLIRMKKTGIILVGIGIFVIYLLWPFRNFKISEQMQDNHLNNQDLDMLRERARKKSQQIDRLMDDYSASKDNFDNVNPKFQNKLNRMSAFDKEIIEEDEQEKQRQKQYLLHKYVKYASIERGTKMIISKPFSDDKNMEESHIEITDQSHHHLSWKSHHLGFNKSAYILRHLDFVSEDLMPEIGNGHLGTVAFSDMIYMNNFYSGQLNASHRAGIPAFTTRNLTSVEDISQRQDGVNLLLGHRLTLDVADGVVTQTLVGDDFIVEQRYYAHRNFTPLIVHEIDIQRKPNKKKQARDLRFHLPRERRPIVSEDLNLSELNHPEEKLYGSKIIHLEGEHRSNEHKKDFSLRTLHIFYTPMPDYIDLSANIIRKKYTFLLSADKKEDVARQHILLGLMLLPRDYLYLSHLDAWRTVWESGHISLSGRENLSAILLTAQYYLYSSLPWRPHEGYKSGGVCPGGLARGGLDIKKGFRGHVYWDQEFWVFPTVMIFHPGIARSLIGYRVDRIKRAKLIAKSQNYRGIQFPWESGRSGIDLAWDPDNRKYQHHVTGDVALAAQSYMLATNDTNFYKNEGGQTLLAGIAKFWSSRLTKKVIQFTQNDSRTVYEIHNAMGPDEFHFPVNNSAYTNAIAKLSLRAPSLVWNFTHPSMRSSVNSTWLEEADKMYVPYDKSKDYTPEFDGFQNNPQNTIKQADVTLLGYPIYEIKDLDTLKKNLQIYEKLMFDGPCMTWGIHTIAWLDLQEYSKAYDAFKRQLMHAKPPFYVWTEYSSGGRTNFLTGIGGFLQSLVNGYLGMRVTTRGLILHPVLPPDVTAINATDFNYLGSQLSLHVHQSGFSLTLIGHLRGAPCLIISCLASNRQTFPAQKLYPNQPLNLELTRYLLHRCENEEVWPSILVPRAVNVGHRLYDEDVASYIQASMERARKETAVRLMHLKEIKRSDADVNNILEHKKQLKKQLENVMHLEKRVGE